MAASVWIAPMVSKPVSDWIERSSAEMTPTESDCSSPNGAADGGHRGSDVQVLRRAERQRAQRQAAGIDLQQGDVGERVEALDLRLDLVAVGEAHEDARGLA